MPEPHNNILKKVKIGLLSEFPAPIIYGGLEMQCVRTFGALQQTGLDVSLVDYYVPEQKIDILHIFGNPPSMYEICVSASKTKKIVISTVFGGAQISRPLSFGIKTLSSMLELAGQKIDHTRVRVMLELASHIISLNEIERDFIIERYNIDPRKITIIANGIDDFYFNVSAEPFIKKYQIRDYVLFTGNINPRKNPLRLALALNKLNAKGVFIGKTVATELAYAQEFEKVINSSLNLLWIQGLSNKDPLLPSAYKASAVFCLPSFAEGQSCSVLEAMASAKPAIMADRPYAYQDGFEHSLKCDPSSVDSISEAIKEVLKHSEKYSYQLPDNYNWHNVANAIIEVYKKL
ncbi:MAG: glycosyltransferase family 4 protein [bacterium]|nr:glycosyltransferase family 4 protein [bacterium]